MSISIRNSTLLYRASLSIWQGRKLDKDESASVNSRAGAVDGAANVHKALLPDCAELKAIGTWASSFRDFIYTSTLPWDDTGWRLGKATRHFDFLQAVGDRITCGEALVEELLRVYDTRVAEAQFKLNSMFKRTDYPSRDEVRRKFRFGIDVMPLPNTDDFRVVEGVSADEAERLVTQAEAGVNARIDAAMQDAYQRLFQVVSKMATTLDAFDHKEIKKFNDSLVGNISELVDAMPGLNVTNDPHLEDLARQARALASYAAADLRKDEGARRAAMAEARALAAQIVPQAVAEPESAAPAAPTSELQALADLTL